MLEHAKALVEPTAREVVERLLDRTGVQINGPNPWDIEVHDDDLYARVLAHGSLGLGEAYMEGWWDAEALDVCLFRLMRAKLDLHVLGLDDAIAFARAHLENLQKRSRAFEVGERHYNVGNDLYERMLGKRLVYSCAYFADTDDLDEAQEAKLDRVCRKLGLEPGMRLLDVGCGWGETLKFAAERYGVEGVGVTVSSEQARFARALCDGLPIDIRLQDYRELNEGFDRIVSVGMFEHVGSKNYRRFMKTVRRCLVADGRFLLRTIGSNETTRGMDPWFDRYIFPNASLPSMVQIAEAVEGTFIVEDWENTGPDYDRTVMAWLERFEASWPELSRATAQGGGADDASRQAVEHSGARPKPTAKFDETFRRMWRYYLCASAALFRARRAQLWSIVMSTGEVGL
ncbi:MAG: cyclopropane fatty acyl phospholipid synthase [Myxococcales bacterium]|nr:cyclopropane fatty acyl phospholipid synthase [Myxococcales bacterium]